MKQVMMIKFDSPKWRMIDEYKVANPFIEVGFRQVKDVVDLRVFDLLNISRINNNRAEEMLLCIYHLLQPDRRIDEGIYNDEIDQYFSYREWKDVIIIAECGAETAKQWRSEKDRHDYLASIEKQSGMMVFSYNTQTTTEDEMSGEELLADNQSDVVEEVLRRFQKAHIQETLAALLPEERDLIESLIISDFPMTEREYAKKVGKTQSTIHCQKAAILKRLKNMLRF